jgi:hypothetical protein
LFGHWPLLFAVRRRGRQWTSRCWLCDRSLIRKQGAWIDGGEGGRLPFETAIRNDETKEKLS